MKIKNDDISENTDTKTVGKREMKKKGIVRKKWIILLLIPAIIFVLVVMAFELREGNVTAKIDFGEGFTQLFDVEYENITLTVTSDHKSTLGATCNSEGRMVLKLSNVGHDAVVLSIPAKVRINNKSVCIAATYVKMNNWYRSTWELKIDAAKNGKTAKISVNGSVDEKGFGRKDEWGKFDIHENIKIDLKKGGEYRIDEDI